MTILKKQALFIIEKYLEKNFEQIDDTFMNKLSENIIILGSKIYMINNAFKDEITSILISSRDIKHLGLYVGEIKSKSDDGFVDVRTDFDFSPSIMFMNEINNSNSIKLPRQKAWLFTNNRTVSILDKVEKRRVFLSKKDYLFRIIDPYNRFLGVGYPVVENFSNEMFRLKIKNVLNIGDYLKREL